MIAQDDQAAAESGQRQNRGQRQQQQDEIWDHRMRVPLDGYAETPEEINEYLSKEYTSKFKLELKYRDVMTLRAASINKPDSASQNQTNNKEDVHSKIDDLLSRELLGMSLNDRNAVQEEIHGVQTIAPKETPESTRIALDEFDTEIASLPPGLKMAFTRSQIIAPNGYIHSEEWRLRFLRCDLFDSKRAAYRMVQFLELLSDLFGDIALMRHIKLSDFTKEEMQFLRIGHLQLLPYRDRSGRRIFVNVGGFGIAIPLVTRVKILLYLMLVASEDVESQRRGLISIVWPGRKYHTKSENENTIKLDRISFLKRVYANLPIRTCVIHFCFPNEPLFQIARPLFILSMPDFLNRMKFHHAESVETHYRLKGFGVPVELIPLTDTGNIKTTYLKQWIKIRRIIESKQSTSNDDVASGSSTGESSVDCDTNEDTTIIECPGLNDVVFRSGTALSCHPGNARFRYMVETKLAVVTDNTQAELAEQLIEEIESKGGKFLKWENKGHYWTELKDKLQVHTKVAMSIRDYKYKARAQKNRQNNQSYTYIFCADGMKRKREDQPPGANRLRRPFMKNA